MKILTKKSLVICTVALLSTIAQSVSAAPQWTQRSKVSRVESGWGTDSYSVRLKKDSSSHIYTNPAHCFYPAYGYVTHPTDTGRGLYQDQLREAFLRGLEVKLLISDTDCPFDKPRIISVLQE